MKRMRRVRAVAVIAIAGMMLFSAVTAAGAAGPTFTFKGDGYGHGLGMSQLGAVGMAKEGWSAQKIITYYFKGTSVVKSPITKRALVHLDSGKAARSSWTIRPGYHNGTLFVDSAGVRIAYPDDFYTFTATAKGIHMTSKSGRVKPISFPGQINVVADTSMPVALNQIVDASGPFGKSNIRYRGYFTLTPQSGKVRLLNSVNIDQYLYGVVPRELGDFYKPLPAASQAQAIAARSYSYAKIVAGTPLACTTSDQVYGGHSQFASEAARIADTASRYEETSANDAVKATKDLVATYGGKVITTYFSACNGEYTANHIDIWGGNLPYLASVRDGYCSHSDHNWEKSYDGSALAAMIASKRKTDASIPAGAGSSVFVSALAPTYGSNGWVKAMLVTWSNGKTTNINLGDNVRIGLGLRSARFTVTSSGATPPPAPAVTTPPLTIKRYEDGNKLIKRSGTWKLQKIKGNSGGQIRTANKLKAYFEIRFKGSEVTWVGPKAPTYGRAKVYVDGVYKKTINLKTKKIYRQQALYRIGGLDPSKVHSLKVVVTTKSGSTKPALIGLDRIDIRGGSAVSPATGYGSSASPTQKSTPPLTIKRYEDGNKLIKRSGTWKLQKIKGNSGGQIRTANKLKAYFEIRFKGSEVTWVGPKAPTYGRAKVYVDGVYKKTINLKTKKIYRQQALYRIGGLDPSKVHSLKVVVTTKSGSTKPALIGLDRIDIRGGSAVSPATKM